MGSQSVVNITSLINGCSFAHDHKSLYSLRRQIADLRDEKPHSNVPTNLKYVPTAPPVIVNEFSVT
ncbi:MAG: hypothetical protein Q8909_18020, partial [Bacteroidota bacterium]|nr:hypothetical protein [Bacteroidota bacterium]